MRRCRELTFVCLVVVALCSWSFPMVEGTSGNQVLTNGTIVFAPLPTDAQEGFVPATYDARGLDGYYSMSNGFTDVVRSGTLPYGEQVARGRQGEASSHQGEGIHARGGGGGGMVGRARGRSEQICGFCDCN